MLLVASLILLPIFFVGSVFLSLAYVLIMWRYIYYWQQLEVWNTPKDFKPSTKISVIIPARNEAANIEACVRSVLNQDYPDLLFEVIVLDDHSTDNTLEILNSIQNQNQNQNQNQKLKILNLADFIDDSTNNAFKKKSIEVGIKQANGDLIVTTDGDCVVPNLWLLRMAHLYESKDLKFIAAPVNFYNEKNMLERFQSLDFTGMMGITGAGINGRFMNMCNGANLAYDKKAFYEVGGFAGINHLASGDDMLLMQKIALKYPEGIAYLKNPQATIRTKAQETWNAFFNQRIRWASKSSDYKEWQVTLMLGIVWLFCINIMLSLISILIFGTSVIWIFLGQLLIKIGMDYALLSRTTRFFNRIDLMTYFLPAQVLHVLYIVIVGSLSIFIKKYTWKGRKVQ